MTPCLDEDTVVAFLHGALAPVDMARVEEHIAECGPCRVLVSSLAEADASLRRSGSRPAALVGDRFALGRLIGAGGMGEVYRAKDHRTGSDVAVKIVQVADPKDRARFERETDVLAQLRHPAIVRYVAHGMAEDGTAFLAMEWLDGVTLAARLADGALGVRDTIVLGQRVADALGAAHEAGVVHRDVKPSNVLLVGGDPARAVVVDFGIARATPAQTAGTPSTRAGTLLGTVGYMAPEQARGAKDADARADVFSLGCVLYECLTGARAFDGGDTVTVLANVLSAPARHPRAIARDVPIALDALVVQMLEKDPDARPADGNRVKDALARDLTRETARLLPIWMRAAAIPIAGLVTVAALASLHTKDSREEGAAPAALDAKTPTVAFHPTAPRRITFGQGCEEYPSFNPDGQSLVYDGTRGRDSFLFERRIDGGEPRQLTHVRGWDMAASVSPDGSRVAFLRIAGGTTAVYVLDRASNAEPRVVVSPSAMAPTWSRDGTAVWSGDGTTVARYDASTGAVTQSFDLGRGAWTTRAMELEDGRVLVNMPRSEGKSEGGLSIYGTDHSMKSLIAGNVDELFAVTPDGRSALALLSRATGGQELLAVPFDGTPPTSLVHSEVTPHKGLALSRDGRHVAWSTCDGRATLQTLDENGRTHPLPGWEWNELSAEQIPNTQRAVVVSSRGGPQELWLADVQLGTTGAGRNGADVLEPRALATPGLTPRRVSVSSDGAWLAFSSVEKGIHVVSLRDRGPPRAVTPSTKDFSPSFVHGTHDILYDTEREDGRLQIMRVSIDGGPAIVQIEAGARFPAASPIDGRIAYIGGDGGNLRPMIANGASRAPISPALGDGSYRHPGRRDARRHVPERPARHRHAPLARRALARRRPFLGPPGTPSTHF